MDDGPAAADTEPAAADTEPAAADDGPATATSRVEPVPCRRVRVRLDATGEIFAPAGRDVPPVRKPIAVEARFDFAQAGPADRPGGEVTRRYRDASATLRIDGNPRTVRLPDDARTLRVAVAGATPVPYLDDGYLSREELDLLETPFDPVLLDHLLPDRVVTRGDSWPVAADAVAGLLSVDTVEAGGLEATVEQVADGRATVAVSGIVDGAADGVPTHVCVEGSFGADVAADGRLDGGITNLTVTIRERREASHVAPGFDVEARLDMGITASAEPTDEAELAGASRTTATLRRLGDGRPGAVWHRDPAGRYDLVHDVAWRVVEDGPDGMVMRLVDHGALVAQCSVTALPRGSAASPPVIAEVERDLERSLAGQFARLEHSSESIRSDGVRVVRVVAAGRADGLAFRWLHHVLADAAGRRLAVTFTLEESLAKRFGDADRRLVEGLALQGEATAIPAVGDADFGGTDEVVPGRQARLPGESRTP